MSVIRDMSSVESAFSVMSDWDSYLNISDELDPVIKTCVFVFQEPVATQDEFCGKFWKFIQTLHDVDCQFYDWDQAVSSAINDDRFEFSLCGRAVFTTTLNPANPRYARKFAFPAWVMNQTRQFDYLRSTGQFARWQQKIRAADSKFDPSGQFNPILVDHGNQSAAFQLAGSAPKEFFFKANINEEDKKAARSRIIEQANREGTSSDILEAIMNRRK